ncbi:hypothetical protein Btru_073931 [Bulinus truncatus]|nr:hypothetical protein Btru_073931 [Bulinus truncatus]
MSFPKLRYEDDNWRMTNGDHIQKTAETDDSQRRVCSSSNSTSHSNAQSILKENPQHIPQYFEERASALDVSQHITSESQLAGCENTHTSSISAGSERSLLTHYSAPYNVHPHNLTDSNNFITWQIKHDLKKEAVSNLHSSATNNMVYQDNAAEEIFALSPRRTSGNISFDDIAVYVVSPKSFTSSGNEQCEFNIRKNCQSKINNEAAYLVQPAFSRSDTFTSKVSAANNSKATNSDEAVTASSNQLYNTSVLHLQAPCSNASQISQLLPLSTSHPKYLIDSEITAASEGSTPCPEDLEVGQISAAMLGDRSQHCPKRPKVETSKSENVSAGSSYSSSSSGWPGDSASFTKAFHDQCLNVPEYIRDNTASAPIMKNAVCSKRKISVEKRERLQGVSDDLLSFSPYRDTTTTVKNVTCVRNNLNQVSTENTMTTFVLEPAPTPSAHHFPQFTGYKAVFTSPSCAGHRLNPNFSETTHPSQLVSHENVHSALVNDASKIPSALVYTNISAKPGLAIADNTTKSVKYAIKTKMKKVERKIVFDSGDDQPVSDVCTDAQPVVKNSGDNCPQSVTHTRAFQPDTKNEVVASHSNVIGDSTALSENHLQYELAELHRVSGLPSHDKRTETLDEMKQNLCRNGGKGDPDASLQVKVSGSASYCHDLIDIMPSATPSAVDENAVLMFYKATDGNYVLMPKENFSSSEDVANFQTFQTSSLSDASNSNSSYSQYNLQPQGLGSDVYINVIPRGGTESSLPQLLVHNFCCPDPNFSQWITISAGNGASVENSPGTFSIGQDSQMPVNNEALPQKQTAMKHVMATADESVKEKCIRKPKKPAANVQIKSHSSHVKKNIASKKVKTACSTSEEAAVKDKDGQDGKKSKAFICKFDNCRYTTTLFKDFQRHYRRHTGERPFECKLCDKRFSRSDKLNIHIRWHAGIKQFKCHICDYASVEGGSLKKHMRIHNDERPFK